MIAAIVFALIGFACLGYSILAFKERGPLISSIYFVAAPAQREKLKTKENYRFVATVFLSLSIIFVSISIGLFFDIAWMAKVTLGLALVLVLYVIWVSVKLEAKKNKG